MAGLSGSTRGCHTKDEIDKLEERLDGTGVSLRATDNLVDRIWAGRPAAPLDPMVPYPAELAGKSHDHKRRELAEVLTNDGQSHAVLTQPDAIAWLLNTRGSDLGQTPVALAFAILGADTRVSLFIDPAKVDASLRDHLGNSVSIKAPEAFGPALDALPGPVRVDPETAPLWVGDQLRAAQVEIAHDRDPVRLPKACKNAAEIAGTTEAHLRDGAAMAEFLAWIAAQGPDPGPDRD